MKSLSRGRRFQDPHSCFEGNHQGGIQCLVEQGVVSLIAQTL